MLYYTILYYTILYYTILHYTILYYTILYYTMLYCTILYKRAGAQRELLHQVCRRQVTFLGHVYHKDDLERQALNRKNPMKKGSWSTENDIPPEA